MRYIVTFIRVILLIYLIVFCLTNTMPVTIVFLPDIAVLPLIEVKDAPVFLVVVASLVLGGIVVAFVNAFDRLKTSKEIRQLRLKLAASQAEAAKLSDMPSVQDDDVKSE